MASAPETLLLLKRKAPYPFSPDQEHDLVCPGKLLNGGDLFPATPQRNKSCQTINPLTCRFLITLSFKCIENKKQWQLLSMQSCVTQLNLIHSSFSFESISLEKYRFIFSQDSSNIPGFSYKPFISRFQRKQSLASL